MYNRTHSPVLPWSPGRYPLQSPGVCLGWSLSTCPALGWWPLSASLTPLGLAHGWGHAESCFRGFLGSWPGAPYLKDSKAVTSVPARELGTKPFACRIITQGTLTVVLQSTALGQTAWVQGLAQPLLSCLSLGKLLNPSGR